MKIPTACPVCMSKEEFTSKPGKASLPQFLAGEMHNSSVIFVTCPKGHRSAVLYNHRRHEIFFASGAMALIDGYTTEAVSSFATALERFYEFCIRVICRKQGMPQNVIDNSWKSVARQSERQFGGFCFLYALETGSVFSLDSYIPKFRNKVLHKGYIPTSEEVFDYAERIFRTIRSGMEKLKEAAGSSVHDEIIAEFKAQSTEIPEDMPRGSMATASMHSSDWDESEAFTKWLDTYRGVHKTIESLYPKEQ